jgi:sporulation protein YlmC with PRC-barrel domain
MTDDELRTLVDLDDTELTVANPDEDLRGRLVIDRDGEHIGEVDGLLIDANERRVCFLQVGSGGFLGLGKKARLIPINALTGVEADAVRVDTTRDQVAGGPHYEPDLARAEDAPHYAEFYDYYGLPAFGYAHPLMAQIEDRAPETDDPDDR